MIPRTGLLRYAVIASLLLGITPSFVGADPVFRDDSVGGVRDGFLSVPDAELGRFDLTFAALAREQGIAIVCESSPLQPTLTPEQVKQLRLALKESARSKAVALVATAFDYVIQKQGSETVVLVKRYSQENDLPDITLAETVSGLGIFLKEYDANAFGAGGYDTSRTASDLKKRLSDADREKLENGALVKELPPELRPLLWSVGNLDRNSAIGMIERIILRLKRCHLPETVFRKGVFKGQTYPYYEGDFYPTVPVVKVSLGWYLITQIGTFNPAVDDEETGTWSKDHKIFTPYSPDPTTPKRDKAPVKRLNNVAMNLGELVETLNARVQKGEQSEVNSLPLNSLSVADGLKSKTVCVFGAESEKPYAILKAVSEIYELPLPYAEGKVTLSLPAFRRLSSPAELPGELRRLIPAPFRRAVVGARKRENNQTHQTMKTMYVPAMRRLRELVEPKLDAAGDQPVPVTEFGDEVRGLIALSTLSTCLFPIDELMLPYPSYLTNFENASIKIIFGSPNNPRDVEIDVRYKDEQTGKASGISGSTMTPPE